ncbi:MAG: DUF4105 domain-containing protein [Oligoflexales bacterium]|nr:DUF4105 domain-containing protein [Oligoflexales bacterium]
MCPFKWFSKLTIIFGFSLPVWAGKLHSLDIETIGASAQWRALLFYSPRNFFSSNSLVDSPDFFLSPEGRKDSITELRQNIILALASENTALTLESYRCRFPARYEFLKNYLSDLKKQVEDCPHVKEFLSGIAPESITLVFSSFYLNNPASMMGHTFLRFNRSINDERIKSPLLDYALNFAANQTSTNPFVYTVLGLTGGFGGTFSLSPYYSKVGEYAQYESRDLWEYELNLTREEVRRLFLTTLELGPQVINYFYIDENCSYVMLFLLDAARPTLELASLFRSIVTPTDTMRAVFDAGVVRSVEYLPSQRSKFLHFYKKLNSQERNLLENILNSTSFEKNIISQLSAKRQSLLIDALVEYIYLNERIIGDQALKDLNKQKMLNEALVVRSQLPSQTNEPVVPKFEQPHLAHYSKLFALGYKSISSAGEADSALLLTFRPNFHDNEAVALGLPLTHGIELLRTEVQKTNKDKNFKIQKLALLKIESLQAKSFRSSIPAWNLYLGMNKEQAIVDVSANSSAQSTDRINDYVLSGGPGIFTSVFGPTCAFGLFADLGLHYRPLTTSSDYEFFAHGAIRPQFNCQINYQWRFVYAAEQPFYSNGSDKLNVLRQKASISRLLTSDLQLQLLGEKKGELREFVSSFNFYF